MSTLILWLVVTSIIGVHSQNLSVNTTQGLVAGVKAGDGDYYTFYGLRYGQPTSDENRFVAPKPAEPYPGEFHAVHKVTCVQPTAQGQLTGSEDCLALDIYTKNETAGKPVIVWLEGEGYLSSEKEISFRRLVVEDLVVVSVNYRVSIFGFLCLGVPEAPGNAGLKDVILALQWIKENIANFGGDPNNVVLLGHGSGAAIVDLITMSPLSQDLVHKAIAISGSTVAPWALSYDPVGSAELVASKLSYSGKTRSDLARLLKTTPTNLLFPALDIPFTNNTVLFAPCLENPDLPNGFLYDAPTDILKIGNFSHIPYLAAYTDREGTIRAAEYNDWLPRMQSNLTEFIQVDLEFGSEANKTDTVNSIREFYFQNNGSTSNNSNIDVEDYLDYHGDTVIRVSVLRGTKARAETSRANVYLLEFAYRGSTNDDWAYPHIPLNGVKHGGILEYLFDINMSVHGTNASTSLINHVVSFAKIGTPALSAVSSQQWQPVSNAAYNYWYFGGAINQPHSEEPRQNPHSQRMQFWNDLYDKYYRAPVRVSAASKYSIALPLIIFMTIVASF
ncbi:carboxylic ester hydrolase-like [Achroia grisella]|uniref:carboxylic ester hydrolase-like n=1 Tax=Achroia grisella TaxID=688607 RepID=UPI0027D33DB7|nr:carboxylic ester hydrolase-like [Achroia grisella]